MEPINGNPGELLSILLCPDGTFVEVRVSKSGYGKHTRFISDEDDADDDNFGAGPWAACARIHLPTEEEEVERQLIATPTVSLTSVNRHDTSEDQLSLLLQDTTRKQEEGDDVVLSCGGPQRDQMRELLETKIASTTAASVASSKTTPLGRRPSVISVVTVSDYASTVQLPDLESEKPYPERERSRYPKDWLRYARAVKRLPTLEKVV